MKCDFCSKRLEYDGGSDSYIRDLSHGEEFLFCDETCCELFEKDPSPWCSYCKVKKQKDCKCGPIAENE